MKTEQVKRALTHVQRAHRQWRFSRWAFVVAGIALIAFSIFWPKMHAQQLEQLFIEQVGTNAANPSAGPFEGVVETAFLQTLVHTLTYSRISLLFGVAIIAFTVGRWWGNPLQILVLALSESAGLSSSSDNDQ